MELDKFADHMSSKTFFSIVTEAAHSSKSFLFVIPEIRDLLVDIITGLRTGDLNKRSKPH